MTTWIPPRRPALVLFDLDGTLSDSADGILTSMRHAFDAVGLQVPQESILRTFVGPPFATALGELGFRPEEIDRLVTAYRADYNGGRLFDSHVFPGVEDALRQLQAHGVELAIATSKPAPTARRIVEHFGLEKYLGDGIDSVFGSDPQRPGETKADVIAKALAGTCGYPKESVLMVGDRLHDVEGARAHGLPCVGVSWGYAGDGELLDAGAAAVVDSPEALVELLMRA